MSIKQREIMDIKKTGILFAISGGFQYWIRNETIYYINSDGINYGVYCSVKRFKAHLQSLLHLTGKRFEEWEDTCIIHPELLPVY